MDIPWPDPGPKRTALIAVLALVGLYIVYAAFVAVPTGDDVEVYIEAGTHDDGSMFYRCDLNRTTPGACDPAGDGSPDHALITVDGRDRVTLTVRSLDGGDRAHDFKLNGWAYFLPPARVEMELHEPTQSTTFTAWKSGQFHIWCELPGHEEAGMWATLQVD